MWDVRLTEIAGAQFNRIARQQLLEIGMCTASVERRLASGRLIPTEEGVYAIAPIGDDDWGRWMGATLTAPETFLSQSSASVAWRMLDFEGALTTVTRPGSGGPRRFGGIRVHRSSTIAGETTELRGIPISTPERTLLDLACKVNRPTLARALRNVVRLEHTTLLRLGDWLGVVRHRRGSRKLAQAVARYSGLPIERARCGAEVRALEVLRNAGVPLPRLNIEVAGIEADLSWPDKRLIIEVDGQPFHQDVGEDARKERAWREAGWRVRRLPSNDVFERPGRLVELARGTNVPHSLSFEGTPDVSRGA